MKVIYLGRVVWEQRNLLGLPQELVCEGLCTPMTLSRFESGRQTPSRDCVVPILQRLGLPDDRFYAQLTKAETQLVRLRNEVVACCSQFEQAFGEDRQQARMNALEKLHDLERCVKADDRINQQFILRIKVTLGTYPPQKQLEMLMEAIRLTSPRFDPDEISKCLYCTNELVLISKIAIRYASCGQPGKAIDIYEQLLKYVLKQSPNHECLHLIAYNYARYLTSEKRLGEALEVAKIGQRVCIKRESHFLLPGFLYIEAECHYLMGETSRSLELYQSAYHLYGAIMDTKNQEILKADVKKRFDLAL